MFNFVIQLGQIVNEKELKLREYMRLMGLKVHLSLFTQLDLNPTISGFCILVYVVCHQHLFELYFCLGVNHLWLHISI